MKIRVKLLSSFLACSLVPMGVLGIVNYFNARHAAIQVRDRSIEGLNESAQMKLAAVSEVKKTQVNDYFENAHKQIRSMAQSPQTVSAMKSLSIGFKTFIDDRKISTPEVPDRAQLKGYYQTVFSAEYS
ncbi:MAG: hypothetical protein ABL921_14270, partial [Pirellula sp.]